MRLSLRSFSIFALTFVIAFTELAVAQQFYVPVSSGQAVTIARLKTAAAAAIGNNPVDLPSMASPPTITQSASHDGTLSAIVDPQHSPATFRNSPGDRYVSTSSNGLFVGGSNWFPNTSTGLSTVANLSPTFLAGDEQNCGTVDFVVTNAQIVELSLRSVSATVPYRIIVNNQFVDRDGLFRTAQFAKMDFGSVQATLNITVEFQTAGASLLGVAVSAGGSISAPVDTTYKMLALGDSITEGSSSGDTTFYVFDRWSSTFAKQAGLNNLRNAGVGTTGYSNAGTGPRSKLINQLPHIWVSGDVYDVVFVSMGFNDVALQGALPADCLAALKNVRLNQPNAFIVVQGIWGESTGPSAGVLASENIISTCFTTWGDNFSRLMRISTDPAGAWITGTGHVGAPTGVGNADTVVSSDGVHPTRGSTTINQGAVWTGTKVNTAYREMLPTLH